MAQFAELVTYREIVRQEPTPAALVGILKKYKRREVIFLLAKINCLLGTWQNTPQFDIDLRLSNYLLAGFRQELLEIRKSAVNKVVFSRVGILFLIKQACLACPEEGLLLNTRTAHSDIGMCLLLTNDLLLPFVPSRSDDDLKRIAALLPFADYVARDEYPMEIGRVQMMLDDIVPNLAERPDFQDVSALFHKLLGLDYKTFCELIFGCASKFMRIELEQIEKDPELAVLRNTYFDKSRIPAEEVAQFFRKMTCTEAAFVAKVNQFNDRPADDLTLFQAYPLLEIAKDIHACLDPGFLVDKAGRNLPWVLFAELPENERGKLFGFWGAVFECYVNRVLSESYSAGGTFIPDPHFSKDDTPVFDACLVEGRNLLVFEHKSSVILAAAKYGGDASKLKAELDLKFIEGEKGGKKGLAQLSNHIARFLRGDELQGISARDVDRIYPVLVCLESTMIAPLLGRYLSERFREIFPRRDFRQVITPVFTLGISDVENLLGYLQSFTLSDVLESYHSRNRKMLTSISSSVVPILKNVKPLRNIVKERFSDFAQRMERSFFGEGAPAAGSE